MTSSSSFRGAPCSPPRPALSPLRSCWREGAQAAPKHGSDKTYDLTVLGTSDTHGNVYNWDYYRDAEYDDSAHNDVGVAKLATLINQIRAERRGKATMVLDAGDTIQGTPLATYYAKQEPITATGEKHPMARAMNVLDYDAVTLGNHEFNYGLPLLQPVDPPARLPGAGRQRRQRAHRAGRRSRRTSSRRSALGHDAPTLRVGILGLTNPGVAIWDRANVEGKLRFEDMVATAAQVGADHAAPAAPTSC